MVVFSKVLHLLELSLTFCEQLSSLLISAHPSGGEVGVLGDVGKVLELQSLSGRCVAHGEDLQDILIAVP